MRGAIPPLSKYVFIEWLKKQLPRIIINEPRKWENTEKTWFRVDLSIEKGT
jgi:hypothetical protein